MSHEVHIPHEQLPKRKEENMNEPFLKWAFGQIPFLVTQIGSLLLALAIFVYYVFHSGETLSEVFDIKKATHIMYYLNLIFCIFCVIKMILLLGDNSFGEFTARKLYKRIFQTTLTLGQHCQRRKQSKYLLSRFKRYFLFFWITMIALYLTFTIGIFNHTGDNDTNSDIYSTLNVFNHEWVTMLVYSFNTVSIMFIFWCFSILAVRAQKPSKYKNKIVLVYLSLFFTAALVAMYPSFISLASDSHNADELIYKLKNLNDYSVLFDALSGVINGIVLALFIARLDSKLLSMPSGLISVLYIYAAVQPLFVVFTLPGVVSEQIKVVVLFLVFFLKIYFFFIITYAIQKGKIFAYLYCFTTLNHRVESIVSNLYRIKIIKEEQNHLKFNYDICVSDFIVFEGHCSSDSEEACLSKIENMRLLARRRENYHFVCKAENWFIQLIDKNKKLYFSSNLSLTSDAEGEEIIDEAMKKIPYCEILLNHSR